MTSRWPERGVVYSPWYFPHYIGGGERLAQLTAAGLIANGVDTAIVTSGTEHAEYAYDDTPVYVVPRGPVFQDALLSVLNRLQPQFVHTVGAWHTAAVGTAAAHVGARFGAAGLDYGQFCDNHRLIRGNQRVCPGRRSASDCFRCTLERERPRDRWLGHLGGWLPHRVSGILQGASSTALRRPVGKQLNWHREFVQRDQERLQAAQRLDVFVTPTQFAKERSKPHLSGKTLCEEVMYPLGDDLWRPEPKRTPDDRLRVGFVGRCLRIKGLKVFVEAVERLEGRIPLEVRIEAATNRGEERDYWEPLKARALAMPNVEWRERGVLDSAALRAFHREIDVLAVPSLWPEYLGFVTLEALGLGTPVLLSDFPPQAELLADQASGALVPPGDVGALAAALERCWRRKQNGVSPVPTCPALSSTEYGRRLLGLYAQVAR